MTEQQIFTGTASGGDTDLPPPPQESTEPPPIQARIFNAHDHYNAAAEALQQIALNHSNPEFTIQDATILVQMAQTHAMMGTLKYTLDHRS